MHKASVDNLRAISRSQGQRDKLGSPQLFPTISQQLNNSQQISYNVPRKRGEKPIT